MKQVHEVLRYHHYTYKTEQTYSQWILRYIHFFECKIHPAELEAGDIERFLSHLAVERKVSASTQRQALNALVFFTGMFLICPCICRTADQTLPPTLFPFYYNKNSDCSS